MSSRNGQIKQENSHNTVWANLSLQQFSKVTPHQPKPKVSRVCSPSSLMLLTLPSPISGTKDRVEVK